MKKPDIIFWLILLILLGFLIQGRQKIDDLLIKQRNLAKLNGELGGDQQGTPAPGRFRASKRSSPEENRAAAEKLMANWLDYEKRRLDRSYDPDEAASLILAKLDILDRLRHIDPDQWPYIIDHFKDMAGWIEQDAYDTMLEVNPRKLLDILLDSTDTDPDANRQIIRSALQACAKDNPVGMIDLIATNHDEYSKKIGDRGKLELLEAVAGVDAILALESISKLGIIDTQSALDKILDNWNHTNTRMEKLEIIRKFREDTDDENLRFGRAYGSIVFKKHGEYEDYSKAMDFIQSNNFSRDEIEMVVRNTPNEAITGHEVEWIDWTKNQNISEELRNKCVSRQITSWAFRSFEEASNWMKMDGDMNLRKACLPGFLNAVEHINMDSDAYIESMPEGELRDYANQYVSERK